MMFADAYATLARWRYATPIRFAVVVIDDICARVF